MKKVIFILSFILIGCSGDKKGKDKKASLGKVDILFVMDNTGSMVTYQKNIIQKIHNFISSLDKADMDYHIGVTTTDMGPAGQKGRLVTGKKGEIDPKKPSFLNRSSLNILSHLKENLDVGKLGHSQEEFFRPSLEALNSTTESTKAHNQGFLRDDAYLALIFFTDTVDQSIDADPKKFLDQLSLLKNIDSLMFFVGLPVGKEGEKGCYHDPVGKKEFSFEGSNLLKLKETLGDQGHLMDLCDKNLIASEFKRWAEELTKAVYKLK